MRKENGAQQQRTQLCQYQMEPGRPIDREEGARDSGRRKGTSAAGNKKSRSECPSMMDLVVVSSAFGSEGRKEHLAHKRILYFPFSASHSRCCSCRKDLRFGVRTERE